MPSDTDEATWIDGGEREASELGGQRFSRKAKGTLYEAFGIKEVA